MALRHNEADLRLMAHKHVFYDVTRMAGYAVQAGRSEAVLEAHLLHLRCVYEFLTSQPSERFDQDVVAADYFDEGWSCSKPPLDNQTVEALNRRLAHLSLDRLKGAGPGGEFDWAAGGHPKAKALRVLGAFGRFLGDLGTAHPERRAWFRDAHTVAKDLLSGARSDIPLA